MSEGGNEDRSRLTLKIPVIKAESETQTSGHLVSRTPEETPVEMESTDQKMSIRKRRNISKNRGQATRYREKTPEPGRMGIPQEETTTSDDEDFKPQRNSREIEADSTYEEMKRLVQEKSTVKDPVYDLDIDEVLEARATAAHERRRRSISPFAVPDKDEECKLEHKGSFTDPKTKLLSTSYTLSPKDEDTSRRNSLTIEPPNEARSSLSPPTPNSASPKDKNAPCPIPSTPKKLEEIIYPDEVKEKESVDEANKKLRTPVTKESVFTFEEKDTKPITKVASTKNLETPTLPGELVTKVIQIERTPSKKLSQESRPVVEVREERAREIRTRIVRTPSRKLSADIKPVLKPQPKPVVKDELQNKAPPVKPARSKSATRFGNKTSESEMSEDQLNQQNIVAAPRRRVVPTPRRFVKNRSPRINRSQSVARVEEVKVIDRTGSQLSQTSLEIVELMQKARARSLSIPKDDPRLPVVYKNYSRNLQTPNKTPSTPRRTREISCPKTIQIISDLEILSGLSTNKRVEMENGKQSRRSSGYIDASQSEYTSSCCSSSASENEYDFDLSERTAELTLKLNLLSQEVDKRDTRNKTTLAKDNESKQETEPKSVLRKRSVVDAKNGVKKERKKSIEDKKTKNDDKNKKPVKSKWKLIANWQQFKQENKAEYNKIMLLRNQCICEMLLLIIMCGLGGMMFKSFEGSFENAYKCGTRNVKRDFIESLWRGSHYLREEDWKSMARTKLYEFENQLHNAHEAGVTSFSGQRSWSFINSFVYCLTLITTIGYGHIAPKTMYGRIATIIYATIGIPLFLIVLADFGKLFTRIIKYFWAFIRRFYYTRSCRSVRRTETVMTVMKGLNTVCDAVRRPSQIFTEEDIEDAEDDELPPHPEKAGDEPPPLPPKPGAIIRDLETGTEPETPAPSVYQIDDEFNLPISVAIIILVMYIVIGAAIFNYWESWDFCDSFYFVFISMSTIGLGDFVPSRPVYMMVTMLYLVFGLALTSMCINVVQVKLSDTFKQASAKLSATIGLNAWSNEEDGVLDVKTSPIEIAPIHKPKSEKEEIKSKEISENDSKNN